MTNVKRILLALFSALLGTIGLAAIAMPAQAATTQLYCNSSASSGTIWVADELVYAGSCVREPKSAIVYIDSAYYKVSYDGGSYSGCRVGYRSFDAYDAPSQLKFRNYQNSACTY